LIGIGFKNPLTFGQVRYLGLIRNQSLVFFEYKIFVLRLDFYSDKKLIFGVMS